MNFDGLKNLVGKTSMLLWLASAIVFVVDVLADIAIIGALKIWVFGLTLCVYFLYRSMTSQTNKGRIFFGIMCAIFLTAILLRLFA